jgi:hypothetical protein
MIAVERNRVIYGAVKYVTDEAIDKSQSTIVIKGSDISNMTIDDFISTNFQF